MIYDLDPMIAKLLPWDCKIQIGGVEYATKPLTVGQLVAMSSINEKDPKSGIALRDTVASMFVEPPAAMAEWRVEILLLILSQVMTYFKDFSKKAIGEAKA